MRVGFRTCRCFGSQTYEFWDRRDARRRHMSTVMTGPSRPRCVFRECSFHRVSPLQRGNGSICQHTKNLGMPDFGKVLPADLGQVLVFLHGELFRATRAVDMRFREDCFGCRPNLRILTERIGQLLSPVTERGLCELAENSFQPLIPSLSFWL